jgi:hypothetical protein
MTRIPARALAFAALLGALAAVQTATAQDRVDQLLPPATARPEAATAPNDGEADIQAPDAAQNPEEIRVTRALNAEITARNELAANQEQAEQAAFEVERARHEAEAAEALSRRLAWEQNVRSAEEAQRRWEADRARWEADVHACEGGDRTRCAPPR